MWRNTGVGGRNRALVDSHFLSFPVLHLPLPTPLPQVPVLEAYAMTEASHQMCSNPLPKYGPHKAGTVGRAQGGVSVAILDAHNRCVCGGVRLWGC